MEASIPSDWWRRPAPAHGASEIDAEPQGGRLAFWALATFTVVLFVVPQQYIPALSAIRVNLMLGALALAAHLFAPARLSLTRYPLEIQLAALLVLWAGMSIPGSYWRGGSIEAFNEYLKVVLIFWLLGREVCTLRRIRIMLWTLVLSTLPLSITAVQNYLSGNMVRGRIQGFANNLAANPNDLALCLNLFLPMAVVLAMTARSRLARYVALATVGASVVGVILTFSRGGLLTLLLEAALMTRLLLKRNPTKVITVGLALAILLAFFAPSGYSSRMGTIIDINEDDSGSAQMRLDDTMTAVGLTFSHPFFGVGLGQGVNALNEARGMLWTNVHNAYLNYGVDTGVPGIVLFVSLVIVSFRSARRVERWTLDPLPNELRLFAGAIRISIAGFMLAGFFHPVGYDSYFFYVSGLAVGVAAAADGQFRGRVAV